MARNLFLDAKELMSQNDALNYINYATLSEEQKEFLRTDVWDFEFISYPAAVYFPGNDLLKARLQSVDPAFPAGIGEISAILRGFTIRQSTISGTTSGTVTLNYIDREDQAVTAFVDDWRDKLGTRENRYAFRKEDTIATGKLTMYNSSRNPIRIYTLHALQPNAGEGGLNPGFNSDDPAQAGQLALPLTFEHFELIWKNI